MSGDKPGTALTISPQSVAVAILWASIGGVGGFTGSTALQDTQQPAVMAQSVALLREDMRRVSSDLQDLRSATERTAFTRTDHHEWVRSTYREHLDQVHVRLQRLEEAP